MHGGSTDNGLWIDRQRTVDRRATKREASFSTARRILRRRMLDVSVSFRTFAATKQSAGLPLVLHAQEESPGNTEHPTS